MSKGNKGKGKNMNDITDIRPMRRGVKATGEKLDDSLSTKCTQEFKNKFEVLAKSNFMTVSELLSKLATDYVSTEERRFNFLSPVFSQATESSSTADTAEDKGRRA